MSRRTSEFTPASRRTHFARLISEIRAGEASATEELCKTLRPGLRWMVCRALGHQDFEDVVSNVLQAMLRGIRIGELKDPNRVLASVRALARDQIRSIASQSGRRKHESEPQLESGDPNCGPGPSPTKGLILLVSG
ncbi:MAG TPA: hypothetical protein VKM93_18475 [Terriglobia bacterium]|nr:hypothetical protein [Terriglobia bacterium]